MPNTSGEPRLLNLLADPEERKSDQWEDHLAALIPEKWDTGVCYPDQLLLVVGKRATVAHGAICGRGHCDRLVTTDNDLCQPCSADYETSDLALHQFLHTWTAGCLVPDCPGQFSSQGLCKGHYNWWLRAQSPKEVEAWAANQPELSKRRKPQCLVPYCPDHYYGHGLCRGHWRRWRRAHRPEDVQVWAANQSLIVERKQKRSEADCLVIDCSGQGYCQNLCQSHYNKWHRSDASRDVASWVAGQQPLCVLKRCQEGRASGVGLCVFHAGLAATWAKRKGQGNAEAFDQVSLWLEHVDGERTIGDNVIGFGALPAPLNLELLAVAANFPSLEPQKWRSVIRGCLKGGVTTAVSSESLPATSQRGTALGRDLARRVNQLHRDWVDAPLPGDTVFLASLNYSGNIKIGSEANVNLDGIGPEMLKEALRDWILTTRHTARCADVYKAVTILGITTEVLAGVDGSEWSRTHITHVVEQVRASWGYTDTQEGHLRSLDKVLQHARRRAADAPQVADPPWVTAWRKIPPNFVRDPHREEHRATGESGRSKRSDEDYRYVPAAVMSHLMDQLHRLHWATRRAVRQRYGQQVITTEYRLLLYVSYALGLRPIETASLRSDCLKSDADGDVMLAWRRMKTRNSAEERILKRPASPELIEAIQDWLDLRAQAGITSTWLFPNLTQAGSDEHLASAVVNAALKKLITAVPELPAPVETAKGARVRFDLNQLEAYWFRHAFAQRCADAYVLDRDGNRVDRVPPVVLQQWMDHKSHDTTQRYYNVSRERQQRALLSLPRLRSFNIHGDAQREEATQPADWEYRRAPQGAFCANPTFLSGHRCPSDENCELCPEWRVLPTDRHYVLARQRDLRIKLANSLALKSPPARIDAIKAGIEHCQIVLDALDRYISNLDPNLQLEVKESLSTQERIVDEHRLKQINIKEWAEEEV